MQLSRTSAVLLPATFLILFLVTSVTAQNRMQASSSAVTLSDELKAFTDISLLPAYRPGTSVLQTSSYDRTGWNDDGFSGRYSFVRKTADSSLVLFDASGPGVINRIWTPTPTEDSIDFYIDDTATPSFTIKYLDLFSGKVYPFVSPLSNNQLGGYYAYLPIPFQRRCMIVLRAKQTQFYQIGYRSLPPGTMVKSFSMNLAAEEKAALQQVQALWNKETRSINDFFGNEGTPQVVRTAFTLRPGEKKLVLHTSKGGRIAGIELEPAALFEGTAKNLDIKITWDGASTPAVYCPVADFFGYAFGNISMQSLLIGSTTNTAYCYFPMPFDRSATMEISYRKTAGTATDPVSVTSRIYLATQPRKTATEGKFYAWWNHQPSVPLHQPHVILNASGKGHFVGTALQARGLEPGMTGFFEGDDSTVVDGQMTMHGTGSEDYFNGGWYAMMDRWDGPLSLPLSGALDYNLPLSQTGGYRLFLSDKIPFAWSMHHSIEHGPEHNQAPGSYTSVAYYYSDTGPLQVVSPAMVDTRVSLPDTMTLYPQLLTINTFGDLQVKRKWAYNTGGESMIFSTANEAAIRVHLKEVPDGAYQVFLDHAQLPEGMAYSLWQRQTPLSDWKTSHAADTVRIPRQLLGNISLTPLNHTITLRFRADGMKNQFFLNRIILVRSKDQ